MIVSVEVRDQECEEGNQVFLVAQPSRSPLIYRAGLGGCVQVGVDLMAPGRWVSVSTASVDDTSAPLMNALVGESATRELHGLLDISPAGRRKTEAGRLTVDLSDAVPWTRVAVVDALDRWLQLPLDQSLVDAERGVSRARAASTLAVHSKARNLVVEEALYLARRASAHVVRYLRQLGSGRSSVPAHLVAELGRLVDGYAALATEVAGTDRQLAAVPRAWRATHDRLAGGEGAGHVTLARPPTPRPPRVTKHRANMIDPRQVRARILALSPDPAAAEVTLASTRSDDGAAVHVKVPAYRRALDQDVAQRLLVRLVDRRSADPRGQGLLTIAPTTAYRYAKGEQLYFRGTVPLRGVDVADVRADVFDALSEVPPALADSDEQLRGVRRAAVFLSEWRRLVALAQLGPAGAAPARQLGELAQRMGPADDESNRDSPAFTGGPTPAELSRIAADGDAALLARLRTADSAQCVPNGAGLAVTHGAGRLLVAELVAAHSELSA